MKLQKGSTQAEQSSKNITDCASHAHVFCSKVPMIEMLTAPQGDRKASKQYMSIIFQEPASENKPEANVTSWKCNFSFHQSCKVLPKQNTRMCLNTLVKDKETHWRSNLWRPGMSSWGSATVFILSEVFPCYIPNTCAENGRGNQRTQDESLWILLVSQTLQSWINFQYHGTARNSMKSKLETWVEMKR